LQKNLFAQTTVIAKVVNPHEIRSFENVRDLSSQEGNINTYASTVQFPPLPQDPSNTLTFLRYLKNSPLAEHGSPGVPPEE
jgi:hypothetical protein